MVSLTNAINFVNHAVGQHWTFLNSHNANDIASIVKVYGWPSGIRHLSHLERPECFNEAVREFCRAHQPGSG